MKLHTHVTSFALQNDSWTNKNERKSLPVYPVTLPRLFVPISSRPISMRKGCAFLGGTVWPFSVKRRTESCSPDCPGSVFGFPVFDEKTLFHTRARFSGAMKMWSSGESIAASQNGPGNSGRNANPYHRPRCFSQRGRMMPIAIANRNQISRMMCHIFCCLV